MLKAPSKFAPPHGCRKCPRLVEYRKTHRKANPDWHNGAVAPWGPLSANLLIIGLAPGLKGAHRTGRVFTGDSAGAFLFNHLEQAGFVRGTYHEDGDDDIVSSTIMITNAIACVPPQNKPENSELRNCQPFLRRQLRALPNLSGILCLGQTAHFALLKALNLPLTSFKFAHGAHHKLPSSIIMAPAKSLKKGPISATTPRAGDPSSAISLFNSYHCSRYNTQTKRLTSQMFTALLDQIKEQLPTNNLSF